MSRFTIYDNGGETADRYTVFDNELTPLQDTPSEMALSLSKNCDSPNGVCQFMTTTRGDHLGEKISFLELAECVKLTIIRRFTP